MHHLFLFLLVISLAACNSNEIVEIAETLEQQTAQQYKLEFDIKTIADGYTISTDSIHIVAPQNTDFTFSLREASTDLNHHFYGISRTELSPDSIILLGTLRFTDEDDVFEHELADIEFAIYEARDRLQANADGSYSYINLADLTGHLTTEKLFGPSMFSNYATSQFLMTLPTLNDPASFWDMEVLTSSGFYWPDEQLEVTEAFYNESSNTIAIAGAFDVQLKVLSCGFYSFYGVSNANFRALIRQ